MNTKEIRLNTSDLLIMNLVHYFITEKNYNPVILHGVSDEIWLENLESDYKIIRIVSHYIHNDEQLKFDRFRLRQILTNLKRKTFSFKMPVISIYTSLGEDVDVPKEEDNILSLLISKNSEINNNNLIEIFPDIVEKTKHKESGLDLFLKISNDINTDSYKKSIKAERVFSKKFPLISYVIILVCFIMFLLTLIIGRGNITPDLLVELGGNISRYIKLNHEYYRLFTSIFLHVGVVHLLCNMYSLYVIGPQVESFYGKLKFLFIYLISGISGSIFSLAFAPENVVSVGASGAIFGLLGSILCFGYHYRVYLGNVVRSQIIPVIIINLIIGFSISGIDNFAHIGGLVGGVLASMAVGVPEKVKTSDRANGSILLLIYLVFIIYLAFFR